MPLFIQIVPSQYRSIIENPAYLGSPDGSIPSELTTFIALSLGLFYLNAARSHGNFKVLDRRVMSPIAVKQKCICSIEKPTVLSNIDMRA